MKVTMMMAMTIDGKIAKNENEFPDWTGSEDKKMFKRLSSRAGVIIMGSKTFDAIGKVLPDRKHVIYTRSPERYAPLANVRFTDCPPAETLRALKAEGYQEVILAGGSKINTLFAQSEMIDEMILTFAPKIFGKGLSLFAESIELDLKMIEMKMLEPDIFYAKYKVIK